MPCDGCYKKFGIFRKENACPACGFSFCSSCLNNKCVVPKLNKVCTVCKRCFKALSDKDSTVNKVLTVPSPPPPPQTPTPTLKQESLESAFKPTTVPEDTNDSRMQRPTKGWNSIDLDILRRLVKLRVDRQVPGSIPSDEEIARRLALLKGQDVNQSAANPSYIHVAPDTRSAEQQTQDLLSQCKEEVGLDGKKIPSFDDDEIAQRFMELKVIPEQVKKMEEDSSSDEDEEKAAAKILSRVQAEVNLEKKLGIGSSSDGDAEEMDVGNDLEELPWCIICNEDAKVRCLDCDRDLYCAECFREGHKDEDMRSHTVETYKKK